MKSWKDWMTEKTEALFRRLDTYMKDFTQSGKKSKAGATKKSAARNASPARNQKGQRGSTHRQEVKVAKGPRNTEAHTFNKSRRDLDQARSNQ